MKHRREQQGIGAGPHRDVFVRGRRRLGAPWIDGRELASALNERAIPGIRFYPVAFTPTTSKYGIGQTLAYLPVLVPLNAIDPSLLEPNFDEFLEDRHRWGSEPFYWHRAVRGWYEQLDYVVDEGGNIACDILRTELLTSELTRYFGRAPDRRHNVTLGAQPYRMLYNARQIQIVADWYSRDIEVFGFDFHTTATRNCLYA